MFKLYQIHHSYSIILQFNLMLLNIIKTQFHINNLIFQAIYFYNQKLILSFYYIKDKN